MLTGLRSHRYFPLLALEASIVVLFHLFSTYCLRVFPHHTHTQTLTIIFTILFLFILVKLGVLFLLLRFARRYGLVYGRPLFWMIVPVATILGMLTVKLIRSL